MGRHCLVATMKLLLLVFVISSAAALETYTETRDITDSAGNTFSCLYTIVYDVSRKVVYRKQSSVQCDPDTNGKQTTEDIIIAEAGMSVAVTYQPRTGKTGIKKTVVSKYTAPTTTAAPTTAAPATTGAPSATGGSMTMDGVMDCTCMPNMTAMQADMESMMDMDMDSMMSATGRAIRYVKKVENGRLRVRPVPVVKDRIIGAILISALRSQIQTAITSAISSLITNALGRSLVPTNKVSKVALRQIFGNLGNGGLLGALAAPATDAAASSGTNIMEDMAMNMAQQQIEQMLSSGQLEEMAMEFLSSGQMEQMVQDFMADPETEQMMNAMMAEVMRPPTEEEAAMMMSMMEEMMSSMMSEEEMAQMEQAWMDWEAQMEEEWKANGGLMGMMGMTGEDMQMMMQMMEMKAHCQCTSSSVAFGQMAMPSMPTAAGRKGDQMPGRGRK